MKPRPQGSLGDLGARIAAAQDEALTRMDGELPLVRERLIARRPGRARAWKWGGGLAAAAAAAIVVFSLSSTSRLTFQIGSEQAQGEVGAFVAVPEGESMPIRFSDGTTLTVASDSAARIVDASQDGARVVLERGRVHAAVRHRAGSRWEIGVGPFDVRVTGTRFDVAWDPAVEAFELRLDRGSVLVSGPIVGESRRISAGETVRVSIREARLEITSQGLAQRTTPQTTEATAPLPAAPEPTPVTSAPAPHVPSWRELARDARYAEALEVAETLGFDPLCARASAADLMLLGDAARLSRNPARATQAFEALRRRFPSDGRAPDAAFHLGRISSDPGRSARWFDTYLGERPQGSFALEASGRLIEALRRAQDPRAADAARRYLARYPNGPHAALARSIVGE